MPLLSRRRRIFPQREGPYPEHSLAGSRPLKTTSCRILIAPLSLFPWALLGSVRSSGTNIYVHIFFNLVIGLIATVGSASLLGDEPTPRKARPEVDRALSYLTREVPQWSRENRCFSCHNNGDAARALFEARRQKLRVPDESLSDTVTFLAKPGRWNQNGVDAAFSDKRLARLQFAMALAKGIETQVVSDRTGLGEAAQLLIKDQSEDGSWPIDETVLIGSPATYGKPLGTALARRVLAQADQQRFAKSIASADRWLKAYPVQNVLDACAVLLGLNGDGEGAATRREECIALLRRAQSQDGGWGPFVNAPSEIFDTALVIIALNERNANETMTTMIQRGRNYLVTRQSEDGSWPETTRPPGGESYAQRLSTTGWATLALLAGK